MKMLSRESFDINEFTMEIAEDSSSTGSDELSVLIPIVMRRISDVFVAFMYFTLPACYGVS